MRLSLSKKMNDDSIQSKGAAALRRIAVGCRGSIDDVLEIMAQLPKREQAGHCMLCFFNLFRKLPPHCLEDLRLVKTWLEREIEVVATDAGSNVVETFPCRIEESEMEDFCHRVMEESRSLLKPGGGNLMLQFRFCPLREERTA